mgnify:FL=1
MQAVVEKTGVNPAEVGDIVVGSVLAPGSQRANECRMAAFYAGFPGPNNIKKSSIIATIGVKDLSETIKLCKLQKLYQFIQ